MFATTATTTTHLDPETAALADWRRYAPGEWLNLVTDPYHVRQALETHVPAFADGAWRLDHCQAKRLRLADESGCWVGTYLVTAAPKRQRCYAHHDGSGQALSTHPPVRRSAQRS